MKVFEYIEVIAHFHQYVKRGNTGNAATFANKLGISRASLFNLINELDSYGIDIEYSRSRETYLYSNPEKVEITILISQHD